MTLDSENLRPAENEPTYLNAQQRESFYTAFSLGNFVVKMHPGRYPYIVISVPAEVQPLLGIVQAGAKADALKTTGRIGKMAQDVPEEDQVRFTQGLSEQHDDTLKLLTEFYLRNALAVLIFGSAENAFTRRLDELAEVYTQDPQQFNPFI